MKNAYKLDGKRMFELENHLIINKDINAEILNKTEQEYIKLAKAIPINDVIDAISCYQKSWVDTDEILFFKELLQKYDGQSEENLMLRFKQAHTILRYCNKELKRHVQTQKRMIKRLG